MPIMLVFKNFSIAFVGAGNVFDFKREDVLCAWDTEEQPTKLMEVFEYLISMRDPDIPPCIPDWWVHIPLDDLFEEGEDKL